MTGFITSAAAMVLVTAVATAAVSLEWPVVEPRLALSFGEREGETIARGVRLLSPLAAVSAVGDGEAVFVRAGAFSSVPASLGGMVVIAHPGGLRSAYAGLSLSFDPAVDGASVEIGERLGSINADLEEPSLFFSFHDAPSRSAVNPATLLPQLGSHPWPTISELRVVQAAGGLDADAVPTTFYHVDVVVGTARGGLPAYRAELLVDGRAERVVTFDSLMTSERAAVALSDGETPAEATVPTKGVVRFVNVSLHSGERHLTVVLSNIAGDSIVRDEVVSIDTTDKESQE